MKNARSRKVAFLAYCLLDQNARAKGIANYPGPVSEIVETLTANGVGIVQMPCPELLYADFDRAPHPKNWYDNKEFRGVCRECAEQVTERVRKYAKNSYQVVGIIGVESSPSCAVKGIFIEELLEVLGSRGLDDIPVIEAYIDKKGVRSTCRRLEKAIAQVKNFTIYERT